MSQEPEIEQWPIERFIEYENNPRVNDHVVDSFAAIIKRFGFRVPMLVKSDGLVVDGHFRLKAARQLGLDVLPVILCDDMSEQEIQAFRLSVNKAAELADWDLDLLAGEMEILKAYDFDLSLIGFDDGELSRLMSIQDGNDADDVWDGMPEYSSSDLTEWKSVKVNFLNQNDMSSFARLIGQTITEKTRFVWYPKQEKVSAMDTEYIDDE